jgi:hypothetical protein
MNLVRHFEVLKRGRVILAVGLLFAIAIALFATFRVSSTGLTWRKPETWQSTTKIMLTQPGFPWGRSVLPGSVDAPAVSPDNQQDVPTDAQGRKLQFADPSRLAYLAWIYSHFLMGDEVRTMIKHKPDGMDISAGPLTAGGSMSASALPIIGLTTTAHTAVEAQRLNDDVHLALEDYLRRQQRESATPTIDRVVLSTVDRPGPVLLKGHSVNLGIMSFLLLMAATVGLVYLLENLRLARLDAEAMRAAGEEPDTGQAQVFGAPSPLDEPRLRQARGSSWPEKHSVR